MAKKENEIGIFKRLLSYVTQSELLLRSRLSGGQVVGKNFKDMNNSLGYPDFLTFNDFYDMYRRNDLARGIIGRITRATWMSGFEVRETGTSDSDSEFEKAWLELYDRLKLLRTFRSADIWCSLGYYAGILLGVNDIRDKESFTRPISRSKNGLELLYVRALAECDFQPNKFETNTGNARYGEPIQYKLTLEEPELDLTTNHALTVHYTRMIHVIQEDAETADRVKGLPLLEAVYNRLMDVNKLAGGSAEMFWRGARPGYQGIVNPEYEVSKEEEEKFEKQLQEYEQDLKRWFVNQGVEFKGLSPQVENPDAHVKIQLKLIAAALNVPERILFGSERGNLASTQDKQEWAAVINARRTTYAEANIIKPFIERLIDFGILPEPVGEVEVVWNSMDVLGEKEKAEIGKMMSETLRNYTAIINSEAILPVEIFLREVLKLDQEDIDVAVANYNVAISEGRIPGQDNNPIPEDQRNFPRLSNDQPGVQSDQT